MPERSDFQDDAAFRMSVANVLEDLLDQFDEIEADIEPRLTGGNLSVHFEDGSVFMLSQQTPTHELWLSANYTAWHFLCERGTWIERDTSEPMLTVLSTLVSEKLDMSISFEL